MVPAAGAVAVAALAGRGVSLAQPFPPAFPEVMAAARAVDVGVEAVVPTSRVVGPGPPVVMPVPVSAAAVLVAMAAFAGDRMRPVFPGAGAGPEMVPAAGSVAVASRAARGMG